MPRPPAGRPQKATVNLTSATFPPADLCRLSYWPNVLFLTRRRGDEISISRLRPPRCASFSAYFVLPTTGPMDRPPRFSGQRTPRVLFLSSPRSIFSFVPPLLSPASRATALGCTLCRRSPNLLTNQSGAAPLSTDGVVLLSLRPPS